MSNSEWIVNAVHSEFIRQSTIDNRHIRIRAFSLVELLTVIFIIGLLIAILVPSLSSARNAAKKMTTAKELDSIKVGLEMFKNENGSEFPQTNGYPPSFSHPPIPGYAFSPELGQFPFLQNNPSVTGAHWLPAMLMGVDQQGYIKRSNVPNIADLRREPPRWYTPNAVDPTHGIKDRAPLYLDPSFPTKKTRDLPGRPNNREVFFPDWGNEDDPRTMSHLPVIVDAFDQPILYYAANTHGRTSNMVEDEHRPNNDYTGGTQQEGPPFYFHQDNWGFTGKGTDESEQGWDFSNTGAKHAIAFSGAKFGPNELIDDANRDTFARYVIDRKIYASLPATRSTDAPLRPVNADSYLLISAGVDGRYGTQDDVSNLPPWLEQ